MTIAVGIEQPEAEIIEICRRHSVSELLGVSAMMRELSALLGRRVDLAIKRALKPLIRPGVLAEARLIYAA